MKSFQIKTRVNFGDNALERLAEVPYKKILIHLWRKAKI